MSLPATSGKVAISVVQGMVKYTTDRTQTFPKLDEMLFIEHQTKCRLEGGAFLASPRVVIGDIVADLMAADKNQ